MLAAGVDLEGLTVDDVACIFDYWADHPPANELLAARYGLKPRAKRQPSSIKGILSALGGTRG